MFPRFLHCFLSNGFEKWSGSLIWSKRQCLTVLLTKVLSCGTWLSSLHGLLPFAARSYSNCSKFPCPRGCKFLFSSWPLCDSFCSGWVFTGMSLQKGFGFFFFFPLCGNIFTKRLHICAYHVWNVPSLKLVCFSSFFPLVSGIPNCKVV